MGSRLAKTDTPSFCSERGQIASHSDQVSSLKHTDLPFSQELLGIASEQETRSESGPVCVRLVRKTLQGQPPGRTRGLPARQAGGQGASRPWLSVLPKAEGEDPEGVRSQGPPEQVYPKSGLMKGPGTFSPQTLESGDRKNPSKLSWEGRLCCLAPQVWSRRRADGGREEASMEKGEELP